MNRIENGQGSDDDLTQLLGLADRIQAKPFCALGDASKCRSEHLLRILEKNLNTTSLIRSCMVDDPQ